MFNGKLTFVFDDCTEVTLTVKDAESLYAYGERYGMRAVAERCVGIFFCDENGNEDVVDYV